MKRKLGEVAEKINSGKTPLGGEAIYTSEGVIFIRSQNVNNDSLELGNTVFISEETNEKMQNSVVYPNDILLNITGASLGRSCVVPDDFSTGNVNQHVCIIRLNEKCNPRFVQPILSSGKGQNVFQSLQTGSGREGLNFENIKGIQLYFPSLNEQNRIADLFSMINIRIQTQNKIIAQLESLMQGLREKLFKKQIRFKDENGNNFPDWEMKSLGNILTIGNGKDYKNLNSGDVPVFGTGGLMTYVDSFLYNGETVCIGRKGTINKPMYYKGKIWTVDTLFYTHSFLNCSPKFIYYIFQSINWLEFNEASGVPSLSKNTIERILLSLPSFPEQIRIANFLTSIDEKIEAEKKILNKYENQKEYLLQNIFI